MHRLRSSRCISRRTIGDSRSTSPADISSRPRHSSAARGWRSSCRHRRCRRSSSPRPGTSIATSVAADSAATLVMRTCSTKRSVLLVVAPPRPAGASMSSTPGVARRHQAVLDRHGHRADRAVAAHRQAARDLDEQDGDVAIGAASADRGSSPTSRRGRAARTSAPVRIQSWLARKSSRRSLMVAPLSSGPAAGDQAHRVAAGMAVEAGEGVHGHAACLRRLQKALNLARAGEPHDRLALTEKPRCRR